MTKIQRHIEIVRSRNAALSSMSQRSCDAIYAVLRRNFAFVGVSTVDDLSDLERLVAKGPDLVFMGVKYVPHEGRQIWVSSYLEDHGIPHTGSPTRAIEADLNKPLAKQRVLDAGLNTSPFMVVEQGKTYPDMVLPLRFPLFVKPATLGGGQGIDANSVVHDAHELRAKTASIALDKTADALIEEYLPGREFSVAIITDIDSGALICMPIELVAPSNTHGDRLLSEEVKSHDWERVYPVTDPAVRGLVQDLAADVFRTLGGRDYGRIDIRMDSAGTPYFLEANLVPSLIVDYGSFPKACAINRGMDHDALIMHIVNLAVLRMPAPEPAPEQIFVNLFEPIAGVIPA